MAASPIVSCYEDCPTHTVDIFQNLLPLCWRRDTPGKWSKRVWGPRSRLWQWYCKLMSHNLGKNSPPLLSVQNGNPRPLLEAKSKTDAMLTHLNRRLNSSSWTDGSDRVPVQLQAESSIALQLHNPLNSFNNEPLEELWLLEFKNKMLHWSSKSYLCEENISNFTWKA